MYVLNILLYILSRVKKVSYLFHTVKCNITSYKIVKIIIFFRRKLLKFFRTQNHCLFAIRRRHFSLYFIWFFFIVVPSVLPPVRHSLTPSIIWGSSKNNVCSINYIDCCWCAETHTHTQTFIFIYIAPPTYIPKHLFSLGSTSVCPFRRRSETISWATKSFSIFLHNCRRLTPLQHTATSTPIHYIYIYACNTIATALVTSLYIRVLRSRNEIRKKTQYNARARKGEEEKKIKDVCIVRHKMSLNHCLKDENYFETLFGVKHLWDVVHHDIWRVVNFASKIAYYTIIVCYL